MLKLSCDTVLANQNFKPEMVKGKLVTKCNLGARAIIAAMGCHYFEKESPEPMLADTMHKMMASDQNNWKLVDGAGAALAALDGHVVIASMPSWVLRAAHGHVAVVYPASRQRSGSLRKDVPMLANIGKDVGVMKSSACFPVSLGEPDYFCYVGNT